MTMLCSCELVIRIPVYDCLITPYMGLVTLVTLGTPPVLTIQPGPVYLESDSDGSSLPVPWHVYQNVT